jgi:hypothetical protein
MPKRINQLVETRHLGKSLADNHGYHLINSNMSNNRMGHALKLFEDGKKLKDHIRANNVDARDNAGYDLLNGSIRDSRARENVINQT